MGIHKVLKKTKRLYKTKTVTMLNYTQKSFDSLKSRNSLKSGITQNTGVIKEAAT